MTIDPTPAPPPTALVLERDVAQVLRRRRRARARHRLTLRARRDPRPRRRERRRQVDAGQDHRRPATSPTRGDFLLRRRSPSTSARPPRAKAAGIARHLPGADALPRPLRHREHLHGPPAHRRASAASTGEAMRAEAVGLFERLGVRDRPRPPRRGPLDRRPADHRDRQGHLARRQGARHGRADGRPLAASRSSACSPSPAACATRARAHPVHLAPLRRGLRALRPHHGHARRRLHLRPHATADVTRRRDRARAWSAATSTTCSPRQDARDRRRRPRGRRAQPAGRLPRHLASRCAPARSSAWPASSAPAAARSPGPSSASTATTPARVTIGGKPLAARNPHGRDRAPASALVPEDRRKQGLVMDSSVARNIDAHPAQHARAGSA